MVGGRDPVSLTCLAFGFATLFWAIVRPWWNFPFALLDKQVSLLGNYSDVHVPMWLMSISLIVLGTIAPFTLSIASLRHLRARQVGVVGMVEPVAATVDRVRLARRVARPGADHRRRRGHHRRDPRRDLARLTDHRQRAGRVAP